jgi:hypothetical protein
MDDWASGDDPDQDLLTPYMYPPNKLPPGVKTATTNQITQIRTSWVAHLRKFAQHYLDFFPNWNATMNSLLAKGYLGQPFMLALPLLIHKDIHVLAHPPNLPWPSNPQTVDISFGQWYTQHPTGGRDLTAPEVHLLKSNRCGPHYDLLIPIHASLHGTPIPTGYTIITHGSDRWVMIRIPGDTHCTIHAAVVANALDRPTGHAHDHNLSAESFERLSAPRAAQAPPNNVATTDTQTTTSPTDTASKTATNTTTTTTDTTTTTSNTKPATTTTTSPII